MRITGGAWASRRLAGPPRNSAVRPTPDALREQAFAVLGDRLRGGRFLDLFAGTGVVSLEALSRGAESAVLVERARPAAETIRRNFAALGVEAERWRLVVAPVAAALGRLAAEGARFTAVWCDPPFASWQEGAVALEQARGLGLLDPGAVAVIESPRPAGVAVEGFEHLRELRGAALLRGPGGGGAAALY